MSMSTSCRCCCTASTTAAGSRSYLPHRRRRSPEGVDVSALSDEELRELVRGREWYHTFELRPGIVTPGWFDLRELAKTLPIPDLTGKRALDIGTFEGFWAYQLEERGADEVLAIDILDPAAWDWPVGSDDSVVAALEQRKQGGSGFEL